MLALAQRITLRNEVGSFRLGTQCSNGERLVNFATDNRLVVTYTRFQHPWRHLVTWYSNGQTTRNQIDFVLVRARWTSSVLDCRRYRGTDTGSANNSDHVLLHAMVRLRLKVNHACQRLDRFDVSKLKTAVGAAFQIELRTRFEALSGIVGLDPETEWAAIKVAAR